MNDAEFLELLHKQLVEVHFIPWNSARMARLRAIIHRLNGLSSGTSPSADALKELTEKTS